ncbi:MAG: ABC transporter permease, partial [Planctomycetes bacterium]|nr:ABC transporter permease [Planctomycetota bacterium]
MKHSSSKVQYWRNGLKSFLRMSLRETAHRPVRTVLTVLSVALGTAAVVAVLLTMASVRKAQDAMFATLTGKTDFLIAAEGGASFDAELLDRISQIQGIQAAVPSISRSTILYVGDRRAKTQVVGVDFAIDNAVRSYRVVQGQPGLQGNHLYVDERFAQSMGLKVD